MLTTSPMVQNRSQERHRKPRGRTLRWLMAALALWLMALACDPQAPTEPPQEQAPDAATEASREATPDPAKEATGSDTTEPDTTPENTPDEPPRDTSSDTSPDASEPVREPTPEPDKEGPKETPVEPRSEPSPDNGEPRPDTAPDGGEMAPEGPPDSRESIPESSGEGAADTSQCTPHTPPSSAPKTWVYDTGEGASFIFVKDIKADAQGFLYVCGHFSGSQATFHGQTLQSSGSEQMFLMKLDAAGKALWVMTLPGQGQRNCASLALAPNGAIYATGTFSGSVPFGGTTLTAQGTDAYVARIDPCGQLQWIVQAGGSKSDAGYDIAIDGQGQLTVYGLFYGPATFGTHAVTTQDVGSIFVARMDPQGNFTWVTTGGSQAPDTPAGLGVTATGEVYIAGYSYLPSTFGRFKLTSPHAFELFVVKLDAKGRYLWAKQSNGPGRIVPYRAGLDANGLFYVSGELDGEKTIGATKYISPAHGDIFLTQIDGAGNFKWVLRPKGTSHLHPYGISFVPGAIYLSGDYTGDPAFGSTQFPSTVNLRSFVTKVAVSSTPSFTWAISTSGSDPIRSQAMTVGPKGDLFVAVNFQSGGVFGSITVKRKATAFYMFVWKIPKP